MSQRTISSSCMLFIFFGAVFFSAWGKSFAGERHIVGEVVDGWIFSSKANLLTPEKPLLRLDKLKTEAGNIDWLRLNFSKEENNDRDVSVSIFGPDGKIEEINFRAGSIWSGKIYTTTVSIQITSDSAPIRLGKVLLGKKKAPELYNQIGTLNFLDVEKESGLKTISKGVALLEFDDEDIRYSCSSFVISDDLLLTNWHCIDDQIKSSSIEIYFDYVHDSKSTGMQNTIEYISTNESLDAALIRFTPGGLKERQLHFVDIKTFQDKPENIEGRELLLIQHVEGKKQQYVIDADCTVKKFPELGRVLGVDRGDRKLEGALGHGCDTSLSSSGSPILDRQTNGVIGLHYWGKGSSDLNFNKGIRGDYLLCWLKKIVPSESLLWSHHADSTLQSHCSNKM